MLDLASFLAKSVLITGIFFLFYTLVLRNRKFHRYNRFYLIGSLLLSLLIPLINLRLYSIEHPLAETTNNASEVLQYAGTTGTGLSMQDIMLIGGSVVSLLLLAFLLVKVAWIYRTITKHEVRRMNDFYFIETHLKQAPFSFLNKLFWRKTISLNEPAAKKIFIHELTHIREKHTYDKLFSQLLVCIFWMNPFYWLIQRELNIVHEFLADAKSVSAGDTQGFAEMLLRAHNGGGYLDPVHPFFNSSVKRRLAMISKTKQPVYAYIQKIAVLPVVTLIVLLFSFTVVVRENAGEEARGEITLVNTMEAFTYQDTLPQKKSTTKQRLNSSEKNPGKAKKKFNKSMPQKPTAGFQKEKFRAPVNKGVTSKPETTKESKPDDEAIKAMKSKSNLAEISIPEKHYLKPGTTKESLKNSNQGEKKSLAVASVNMKMHNSILKDQDVGDGKKDFQSTKKGYADKLLKPITETIKPQRSK